MPKEFMLGTPHAFLKVYSSPLSVLNGPTLRGGGGGGGLKVSVEMTLSRGKINI